MKNKLLLFVLVSAVLLNTAPVWADGDFYVVAVGGGIGTKITSLPCTITTSGLYYLGSNLTTSGNGITVDADDVTLDLMGFRLTGPGRDASPFSGISIADNRGNAEIRNGSLNGFYTGISGGSTCHGIRVIGIRVQATNSGIFLAGNGNLVMECSVINSNSKGIMASTSDASLFKGNLVAQTGDRGIWVGSGANVTGNVLTSNGGGIRANYGSLVTDNTVSGSLIEGILAFEFSTVTRNTASNNGGPGIATDYYCTITNNTTDGLTYGSNCTLADNTVW